MVHGGLDQVRLAIDGDDYMNQLAWMVADDKYWPDLGFTKKAKVVASDEYIAGLVGGVKAGSVKGALLAVFVPGVMIGVMVAAGVGYLTDVFWGLLAGLGGVALSFLNIGPLLLGAVLGGLSAGLWARRDRRGGV